jgi:hypothetical protein
LLNRKGYLASLKYYDHALRLSPENKRVIFSKSSSLFNVGRYFESFYFAVPTLNNSEFDQEEVLLRLGQIAY